MTIASVFAATYWIGSKALFQTADAALLEQLELLAARPPDLLAFMVMSRMNHQPLVITRVGLFDAEGHVIAGDILSVPPQTKLDGKVRDAVVTAPDGTSEDLRTVARRLPDGRLLVVAREVAILIEMRSTLLSSLVIGLLAAATVSLAAGATFGLLADRRLRRIGRAAERIVDGAIHERLPSAAAGDDFDALCAIVNRILDRLEELVQDWKHIGEAIAHETRTPLTAVRARLARVREEGGLDQTALRVVNSALSGIDDALASMTALLRIAEIERDHRVARFEKFDLAAAALESAENFLPLAEDVGAALTVETFGPVMIFGDRDLMVEALVNLIDNAIKFSGRGHAVHIGLTGSAERPTLRVADDGPGIPAEVRTLVFQRFHRLEAGRSTRGNGLGLTLVQSICRLHRFDIHIVDNHPGCSVELSCWPGSDKHGRFGGKATLRHHQRPPVDPG